MEQDMTLLKSPDQFRTKSGLVRAKDWTNYLFSAIMRETGEKWKPISSDVGLWTRVISDRANSGLDPFVLALMVDIISLEWERHQELSPWQLTAPEHTFRFFVGRKSWFWRAVWFSRYAKGDKEVSLYIEYLVKSEVAHNMDNGTTGKLEGLASYQRILEGFEPKVVERRKDEYPSFELHWLKEKYSEWSN